MRLKTVKIGNLQTPNNLFLAPLAGYTNAVFREMCSRFGAGLTFTEMVSAKGLAYDSKNTRALLAVTREYKGIKACQIFGNDSYYMRKACESEELAPFDLIDLNMGCPVPKIFKNGEGSALMGNLPLASEIISECKKSGKNISVKFRTGLDDNSKNCVEFAKMCQDSGADMITIHGRTRDKMYSGEVDYEQIALAKNAVNIPVIANGGVFCESDAQVLLDRTGADGIAVARGAMYAPWIFCELSGMPEPDRQSAVLEQLKKTRETFGERFACVFMRKMAAFYLRGTPRAAEIRAKLLATPTCGELEEIILHTDFN